jgi:hypothetical protein
MISRNNKIIVPHTWGIITGRLKKYSPQEANMSINVMCGILLLFFG